MNFGLGELIFSQFSSPVIFLPRWVTPLSIYATLSYGLRMVCRNLRAWVVPHQVSIAQAWKAFDDSDHLKDRQLEERIEGLGSEVARFAFLHHSEAAKEFLRNWEQAPQNPGGGQ